MGYFCKVSCPSCGYDKTFPLGCGRKDYKLNKIYAHFDMMDVWQIKVAELQKHSNYLVFRYRLGRCSDCGKLQAAPEVLFEDGTSFHGRVCKCKPKEEHRIELYEEAEQIKLNCPECGASILTQEAGMWD